LGEVRLSRLEQSLRAATIVLALVLLGVVVWLTRGERREEPPPGAPPAPRSEKASRSAAGDPGSGPLPNTPPRALSGGLATGSQAAQRQEVEEAVLEILTAYNKRDIEAFIGGWTDRGFFNQQLFTYPHKFARRDAHRIMPVFIGVRPFTVTKFSHTIVSGDNATTEVELIEGKVESVHRLSLVREGRWKIDHDERLRFRVPDDVVAIDVTLKDDAIDFDASKVARNMSFKVVNAGADVHDLLVMRILPETGAEKSMAILRALKPGDFATLVLRDLESGRYVALCNRIGKDSLPYSMKGMRNEFTIP
jgi:hypothetical protein